MDGDYGGFRGILFTGWQRMTDKSLWWKLPSNEQIKTEGCVDDGVRLPRQRIPLSYARIRISHCAKFTLAQTNSCFPGKIRASA